MRREEGGATEEVTTQALTPNGPHDPVRNICVTNFGVIVCVLVSPLAVIFGLLCGIPFYWRLLDWSFGDYAIDGKTAPDLVRQSEFLYFQDKHFSAAIYALAAQKVMRPLSFLQYRNETDYSHTIRRIGTQLQKECQFPKELKNVPNVILYSLDVKITTSGISPLLKYKTAVDLASTEKLTAEAGNLLPEFISLFPDLKESFQYVILQAYNELPENPTKTYPCYNIVFKDGKPV